MPTYLGLVNTLYDLYCLRYARKRRNYRVFCIDDTFCKDSGHLFKLSFLNANHHLQPMGCYFGRFESSALMMLLFDEMWKAGMNEVSDQVFMYDDGAAINYYINDLEIKHEEVMSKGISIKHVKCVVHY